MTVTRGRIRYAQRAVTVCMWQRVQKDRHTRPVRHWKVLRTYRQVTIFRGSRYILNKEYLGYTQNRVRDHDIDIDVDID